MFAGDKTTLVARTLDAAGRELSGRAVNWRSSDATVASVTADGEVQGVGAGGPVTITATSENRSGTAVIIVAADPPGMFVTGIRDASTFVDRCPTSDPAYQTIRRDFELLSNGQPSTVTITCTEPYTTVALALLTDELLAMQTMRLVYYMSQGSAGKLPWTPLGFYEWMTSEVAGVNIVTQQGLSACCQLINGKKYIITSRMSAANRDVHRDWNSISGWAALFAHEARHASGPGHVGAARLSTADRPRRL
jgi:hypothetical protein